MTSQKFSVWVHAASRIEFGNWHSAIGNDRTRTAALVVSLDNPTTGQVVVNSAPTYQESCHATA